MNARSCIDIDSWEAWSVPLERAVQDVTYALLDGTFSSLDELPAAARRAEVPHPPVHVTISRLAENQSLASRVTFTHLNHTNPLLWDDDERRKVTNKGFRVAHDGLQFVL